MGIREDLKIPLSMLSLNYLNANISKNVPQKFKGSYKGKRFIFEKYIEVIEKTEIDADGNEKKITEKAAPVLLLYVWKDLFNFENTKEEEIIKITFTYDNDGISKGLDFIEEVEV